jgi:hypothetical protein
MARTHGEILSQWWWHKAVKNLQCSFCERSKGYLTRARRIIRRLHFTYSNHLITMQDPTNETVEPIPVEASGATNNRRRGGILRRKVAIRTLPVLGSVLSTSNDRVAFPSLPYQPPQEPQEPTSLQQEDELPPHLQQYEYIPAAKRPRVETSLPDAENEAVDTLIGTVDTVTAASPNDDHEAVDALTGTVDTDTVTATLPEDENAVAPSIGRDNSLSAGGGTRIGGLGMTPESNPPTDLTTPMDAAERAQPSIPMNRENSEKVQHLASRGDETIDTMENDSQTTTAVAIEKETPTASAPKKKKKPEQKYKSKHDLKYGVEIHKYIPATGDVLEKVLEVRCRFCVKFKKRDKQPKIFKLPLRTDNYKSHSKGRPGEIGAHEDEWARYQELDLHAREKYWREQDEPEATATTAVAAIEET